MAHTEWNKLRLEGKLCDVVITVDDMQFSAHKIVLSTCSDYFRWVAHRKLSLLLN